MDQSPVEMTLFAELDLELRTGKLNADNLKKAFAHYADINFLSPPQPELLDKLTPFYCEGMVDKNQLNQYFSRVCHFVGLHPDEASGHAEEMPLYESIQTIGEMVSALFRGNLILYRERDTEFWVFDIAKVPQRALQESNTEISIKGPKDAFTEDLYTNISLIRKRMQTGLLYNEQFVIGSLSQTRVALLYLNHKANPKAIAEVRKRLETFHTESIVSSGQLEQWLSDRTFALFPLIDYIGRPDFVIETMLRGRFTILVDGSPMALIGPVNFLELIKTPEDVHFPFHYVILQRLLRFIGLMLSIFLPGFWLSIATVNLDQIPFALLSTVVLSREGVPFPSILEALLLLFLFELLREAGIRLPKAVGQTIGIVGGLIIGEAVIRAGLASPTLLIVIAISAVSTFSLVNQSLSGTVGLLRIFIMAASIYLGIFGFLMAMFVILIYLCRLESFGLAYLEPISSLRIKEWLAAFFINPYKRTNFSSKMLKNKDGE